MTQEDLFKLFNITTKKNVVYRIYDIIYDKSYIGSTTQLRKRINQHMNGKQEWKQRLKNLDNIIVEVLEYVDNPADLEDRELYYINKYDSINNGYNKTQNVARLKHISKEYNSDIHKTANREPETNNKIKESVHEWYNDPANKEYHAMKTKMGMKAKQQRWMTNGIIRGKIDKDKQEYYLANGWYFGWKLKEE